jgi:hypothetical protein
MVEVGVPLRQEWRIMNTEFALRLTDIRLLQTLRLLEVATSDHPDQEAIMDVLAVIRSTRDTVAGLRAELTVGATAAHKVPAA